MQQNMTAVILAGGQARRMGGVPKAFLTFKGETFIQRKIRLLSATDLIEEIIIVVSHPREFENLPAVIIKDEIPGKGPLMGLYSGLKASSSEINFITTVDSPFCSLELVRYLAENLGSNDVHVPMWRGYVEPLFGVYTRKCLPGIEENLEKRKVVSFYPEVEVKYTEASKVAEYDPGGASFLNINTWEDYSALAEN